MMKMRRKFGWQSLILASLISVGILGFQRVNASPVIPVGLRNEYTVLQYFWPVLKQSGKAGRIYYATTCHSDIYNEPDPLNVTAQPPSKDLSGLAAVKDIFRNDRNIEVTESPPGIIRVRIGKVPDAILQTKINLTIKPDDLYDDFAIMRAIYISDEVHAAEKKLGVKFIFGEFSVMHQFPVEGLPHISGSFSNVTMDEALDTVAQTFKGIVIYRACSNIPRYEVRFAGGYNFIGTYDPVRGNYVEDKSRPWVRLP